MGPKHHEENNGSFLAREVEKTKTEKDIEGYIYKVKYNSKKPITRGLRGEESDLRGERISKIENICILFHLFSRSVIPL